LVIIVNLYLFKAKKETPQSIKVGEMADIIIGEKRIPCNLIIFDLDGTLIDAEARFRALAEARMRVMSQRFGGEAASLWARF